MTWLFLNTRSKRTKIYASGSSVIWCPYIQTKTSFKTRSFPARTSCSKTLEFNATTQFYIKTSVFPKTKSCMFLYSNCTGTSSNALTPQHRQQMNVKLCSLIQHDNFQHETSLQLQIKEPEVASALFCTWKERQPNHQWPEKYKHTVTQGQWTEQKAIFMK